MTQAASEQGQETDRQTMDRRTDGENERAGCNATGDDLLQALSG